MIVNETDVMPQVERWRRRCLVPCDVCRPI